MLPRAVLPKVGRLGEAIEMLQDDSADPRRLAALAELLTRADRLPEAEDALRRALLAAPLATPLAVTRASLLFRLSRYTEAREVLGPVLEQEPNHAFAHYYLGAIALRTADPETAVRHAQRAITGFPENAGAAGGSDSSGRGPVSPGRGATRRRERQPPVKPRCERRSALLRSTLGPGICWAAI